MNLTYNCSKPVRIDKFLASQDISELYSRSMIEKLINSGFVLVNGKIIKKNYLLQDNDSIDIDLPEPEPSSMTAEYLPLDIIFEDQYMAIINKPAGVMVHPSPGNYSGTIANAALYRYGENLANHEDVLRPGIVHRLDKDTSGLLIIAKDDKTLSYLNKIFSERQVSKTYKAVVAGVPNQKAGIIDQPICRSNKDRTKMRVSPDGKKAVTRYQVEQVYSYFSLLEVVIETGRTHQIRVHLDSINCPVLADNSYGTKKLKSLLPLNMQKKVNHYLGRRLKRQALHAYRLGFKHPVTGDIVDVAAPLPDDMVELIKWLERYFL